MVTTLGGARVGDGAVLDGLGGVRVHGAGGGGVVDRPEHPAAPVTTPTVHTVMNPRAATALAERTMERLGRFIVKQKRSRHDELARAGLPPSQAHLLWPPPSKAIHLIVAPLPPSVRAYVEHLLSTRSVHSDAALLRFLAGQDDHEETP